MIALISDIHANAEALCKVLEDIEQHDVSSIVCLGDIVGYGPDPEACVDAVINAADTTLMGNHDYALINGPLGFSAIAAEAIVTTRELMLTQLREEEDAGERPEPETFLPCARVGRVPACLEAIHRPSAQWRFLSDLPGRQRAGRVEYVHASPLDPVFEYVFPDIVRRAWRPDKITRMFERVDWVTFCGHTHIPCAIDNDLTCIYTYDIEEVLQLEPDRKYIVNTGSVGQPRDRDPRASYLLFDEEQGTVRWRRIPYDIEAVVVKIEAMCGISNFCGERLRTGS